MVVGAEVVAVTNIQFTAQSVLKQVMEYRVLVKPDEVNGLIDYLERFPDLKPIFGPMGALASSLFNPTIGLKVSLGRGTSAMYDNTHLLVFTVAPNVKMHFSSSQVADILRNVVTFNEYLKVQTEPYKCRITCALQMA